MTESLAPEALFELAVSRKRPLTSRERRQAIEYLDDNPEVGRDRDPETHRLGKAKYASNYQLADLFGVSEITIRRDRKSLLGEYTRNITRDQAMGFVGEHLRGHDRLIREAQAALVACEPGTLGHRDCLRLLSELLERRIKLLQGIGAVPKELGRLSVSEELWIAEVDDSGNTSLHREDGSAVAAADARTD